MAIKALNPFEPDWYKPAVENGAEHPTRFKLKGLNGTQMNYISPELTVEPLTGKVTGISGKGIELALGFGLVDWENFDNDKGPVRFNRANFANIPSDLQAELVVEILRRSQPDEAARKN